MTDGSAGASKGPDHARTRVVVADDEAMIRGGIRAILSTDESIDVVAEAADGHEAVETVTRFRPDVVLLDIRMPRMDGLAATRELVRLAPETKVAILTTFGEDEYVREALGSGAVGFLLKASDPRELLDGVHAVAAGGAYLSPRIARHVVGRFREFTAGDDDGRRSAQSSIDKLTARERDVLAMLGAGYSNAQIGRRLHLVEGTVKGHVSSILLKLDAGNRVRAAVIAYQAGLIDG